jgi:hypothetical protein
VPGSPEAQQIARDRDYEPARGDHPAVLRVIEDEHAIEHQPGGEEQVIGDDNPR